MVTIEGERGEKLTPRRRTVTTASPCWCPAATWSRRSSKGSAAPADGRRHRRRALGRDLEMKLETAETITVTSEAPMVDKFNVTAGATVTSEVGAQAAGTTRTYYGVINMLPGVTSDADNRDISEMRPSVNGGHFADQSVYIDGVDTTFSRLGGSRVILPTTATTEVTMEAGGAGAEYGRAVGSSTNVIVKSGTNNFHGEVARPLRRPGLVRRVRGPPDPRRRSSSARRRATSSSAADEREGPDRREPRGFDRRPDPQGQGLVLRRLHRQHDRQLRQDPQRRPDRRVDRVRVDGRQGQLPAQREAPARGHLHRRADQAASTPTRRRSTSGRRRRTT